MGITYSVVGVVREVCCIDWIAAICRVGHDGSDRRTQTDRVGFQNIGGSLIEESSKLSLIRGIEQKCPKTIVRVHHFDDRLVVVAVQG